MSVGQRVEVSLTGLPGREGLWHSYYPGVIVECDRVLHTYHVRLEDFQTVWVEDMRVFPERFGDTIRYRRLGDRVDVQLPDISRPGDEPVAVWWTGTLRKQVRNLSNGFNPRYWIVEWDCTANDKRDADDRPMYEGIMRTHAPMDWKPLLFSRRCVLCAETTQRLMNGRWCPSCYALKQIVRTRGRQTRRHKALVQWTLQLGGLSKRRDRRLIRQFEEEHKK